ncbi:MAG: hypothetical protein PHS14_20530 [Elusimicrobia bacterium]|nr:hypothetical protein [Elusimicrobiota bacterium]
MNFNDFGIKTPEAASALASEMRKAATGEYGFFDMSLTGKGVHKTTEALGIQKDATNQIGVVTGLGLLGVPLEVPAKLVTPFPTLLVNRIPRKTVGGATVTFRKVTAVNSTNIWPGVAEASDSASGRNSRIARNEANITVTFKSLEMEDMFTPEALFGSNSSITPGQDFQAEDFARLTLLLSTKVAEEKMLLGGNVTALGNVLNITKTPYTQLPTGVGGLANATNYNIQVTALTLQGFLNGSKGGGAVGETGAAAATVIATTAGGNAGDESISFGWDQVPGAVAYNVYVKTGAAAQWLATTTVTYYQAIAEGAGNVVNVADNTDQATDYDGLIAYCTKAALGRGYFASLATTAAGAGVLSTNSKGGVAQFDTAFKAFYDDYKVGPDEIFVSSTVKDSIDTVALGATTGPLWRIDATAGDINIKGTLGLRDLMNRYMPEKAAVPVTVHPYLPAGTALFATYNLGSYYTASNVGANLQVLLGWDYRAITFAMAKRATEIGIDLNGALVCYAPFALGAIQNIG